MSRKVVAILVLCSSCLLASQTEARPVTEATAKAFRTKVMGYQTKKAPFPSWRTSLGTPVSSASRTWSATGTGCRCRFVSGISRPSSRLDWSDSSG